MYCSKCGKAVRNGDAFCSHCGNKLPLFDVDVPAQEEIVYNQVSVTPMASSEPEPEPVNNEPEPVAAEASTVAKEPESEPVPVHNTEFVWDVHDFSHQPRKTEDLVVDWKKLEIYEEQSQEAAEPDAQTAEPVQNFAPVMEAAPAYNEPDFETMQSAVQPSRLEEAIMEAAKVAEKLPVQPEGQSASPFQMPKEPKEYIQQEFKTVTPHQSGTPVMNWADEMAEFLKDKDYAGVGSNSEYRPAGTATENRSTVESVIEESHPVEAFAEESFMPQEDMTATRVYEPIRDAAIGAAAVEAAVTIEDIAKDIEESAASRDASRIEKFYTYNQKLDEYQSLLDKEYERVKQGRLEEAGPIAAAKVGQIQEAMRNGTPLDELDFKITDIASERETAKETEDIIGKEPETEGTGEDAPAAKRGVSDDTFNFITVSDSEDDEPADVIAEDEPEVTTAEDWNNLGVFDPVAHLKTAEVERLAEEVRQSRMEPATSEDPKHGENQSQAMQGFETLDFEDNEIEDPLMMNNDDLMKRFDTMELQKDVLELELEKERKRREKMQARVAEAEAAGELQPEEPAQPEAEPEESAQPEAEPDLFDSLFDFQTPTPEPEQPVSPEQEEKARVLDEMFANLPEELTGEPTTKLAAPEYEEVLSASEKSVETEEHEEAAEDGLYDETSEVDEDNASAAENEGSAETEEYDEATAEDGLYEETSAVVEDNAPAAENEGSAETEEYDEATAEDGLYDETSEVDEDNASAAENEEPAETEEQEEATEKPVAEPPVAPEPVAEPEQSPELAKPPVASYIPTEAKAEEPVSKPPYQMYTEAPEETIEIKLPKKPAKRDEDLTPEERADREKAAALDELYRGLEEDDEDEKPAKSGASKFLSIVIAIAVVLLVIELGMIAVQKLIPQSGLAKFINDNLGNLVLQIGGGEEIDFTDGDDVTEPEPEPEPEPVYVEGTPLDGQSLVTHAMNFNDNITSVSYDESLCFDPTATYTSDLITNSTPMEYNIWYRDENGNAVFSDRAVADIVTMYDSMWIDYVVAGDESVFTTLKEGSNAYKNCKNFSKAGQVDKRFLSLKIGEIRETEGGFLIWTSEEIQTTENGKTSTSEYRWIYYVEDVNYLAKISDYFAY